MAAKPICVNNTGYLALRRAGEFLLILLTLPVTLPVCLVTAIIIKLDSKGGAFFTQIRPGKGGSTFAIYKFRSMRTGADSSYLTLDKDDRVTRVGRFIRKYRIDELPQLYNVLRGDMSLIGPRPVPINFLERYQAIPNYNSRHLIRPGITGLAQVRQGYTTTFEQEAQKLKYDLFYIQNVSPALDWAILVKTITNMMK